jgi:hypothetical protein
MAAASSYGRAIRENGPDLVPRRREGWIDQSVVLRQAVEAAHVVAQLEVEHIQVGGDVGPDSRCAGWQCVRGAGSAIGSPPAPGFFPWAADDQQSATSDATTLAELA